MARLDARGAPGFKELAQAFVPERLDHDAIVSCCASRNKRPNEVVKELTLEALPLWIPEVRAAKMPLESHARSKVRMLRTQWVRRCSSCPPSATCQLLDVVHHAVQVPLCVDLAASARRLE